MDRNRWPEFVGIRRLVTNQGIFGKEIRARQSLAAPDWRPMRELADRIGKSGSPVWSCTAALVFTKSLIPTFGPFPREDCSLEFFNFNIQV